MSDSIPEHPTAMTRRRSLVQLGGLVAGVAAGARLDPAARAAGPTVAGARCVLAPEQTEGPYYIPREKVRRNISEGRPGVPLQLQLQVVDVASCRGIAGASVDVWHCDAGGVYSGVAAAGAGGRTFLRGIQRTDARGVARFDTIYPGWYPGRTVHVHVKVHVGGTVVHTGQLYFPDTLTDAVYRQQPYRRRPRRDTRNGQDGIFQDGGRRSLLALRRRGAGYVGALALGVRRA
jgi:protocatechuate 3,4-dioxygenase beta subunit